MSKKAHQQARLLCNNFKKVEWNSTILYTKEYDDQLGEYFEVQEVIPHTIGTGSAADFSYAEIQPIVMRRLMELSETNPNVFDYYQGVMHSHHNMNAYFSTDDNDELYTNTPLHNQYLSIVTNNEGCYVAKMGYNLSKITYTVKTENGEVVSDLNTNKNLIGVSVASDVVVDFDYKDNSFDRLITNMKKTSYDNFKVTKTHKKNENQTELWARPSKWYESEEEISRWYDMYEEKDEKDLQDEWDEYNTQWDEYDKQFNIDL